MQNDLGSNRTQLLAHRRHALAAMGATLVGALAGCAAVPDGESSNKPVNVLLQNDDTEKWQLTVAVEDETGEEMFRTEETIPADTGEDLGEVQIEDAFKGTTGDQFTIRVWLEDEPAGTFDYEVTCPDDNQFSLLVEHTPTTLTTVNQSITSPTGVVNKRPVFSTDVLSTSDNVGTVSYGKRRDYQVFIRPQQMSLSLCLATGLSACSSSSRSCSGRHSPQ